MPVAMPGYEDYDKILSMNPWAQMQANEQLGLAQQFQQQEYQRGTLGNEKASLDNMFTAQDNPLRVRERQLSNVSKEQANETGELGLERARANQKSLLSADQRKAAMSASEDEIKQLDYNVGLLLRSKDPQEREEGLKLQQYMPEILAERRKQADAMEKERYTQMQQTGRDTERNATTIRAAEIGANSRQAVANTRGSAKAGGADFWSAYYKQRGAFNQYSMLIGEIAKIKDTEPEEAARMQRMADDLTPAAQAAIATTKPGAINQGALTQLPVNPPPQIAPTGAGTKPTKAEHSLAKVQEMYPGVPAEKLKEVYKKKFGVDLK
jgi:hypothetical protein